MSANCGNKVRDGEEACDGGFQCAPDCRCNVGFEPESSLSVGCKGTDVHIHLTHSSAIPFICGNLQRDTDEDCDGGVNCEVCKCKAGFEPESATSISCKGRYYLK